MALLLIIFFILIVVIVFLRKSKIFTANHQIEAPNSNETDCHGNCGTSCAMQCKLDAIQNGPIYYSDEELDAFKGIGENEYSSEQIELFDDVLNTLNPNDIYGWLASLEERGINLPAQLKDVAYIMIKEYEERQ